MRRLPWRVLRAAGGAAVLAAWVTVCAAQPQLEPQPELELELESEQVQGLEMGLEPQQPQPQPVAEAAVPAAAQPVSAAVVEEPASPALTLAAEEDRSAPALRMKPERAPGEGSGPPALRAPPPEPLASGQASWYADSLHGRRTANGERYDREEFTAAHRSLPFGARLCVRSLVNGRTVIVRVNDRGPFVSGRIIDLSRAAAEELGMMGLGIKPVELWQLGAEDEVCPESLEQPVAEGTGLGLDARAAARALQRPAPRKAAGARTPRRKRR